MKYTIFSSRNSIPSKTNYPTNKTKCEHIIVIINLYVVDVKHSYINVTNICGNLKRFSTACTDKTITE